MNSVQSTGHTGSMSKKDQIEVIVHFVFLFYMFRVINEGALVRARASNFWTIVKTCCRFCEMSWQLWGIPIIKNISRNPCVQMPLEELGVFVWSIKW